MLMHQGIGLEAFNGMPETKAVHALFECCGSVTWARKVAAERPFSDHDALFRCADNELFALSDEWVDEVLTAHPPLGHRPGSNKSHAEQCAICDESPGMMAALHDADTERKVTCNELAKINRTRLERMLGPEGGYEYW